MVDEESAARLMSCGGEMVCFVRVWRQGRSDGQLQDSQKWTKQKRMRHLRSGECTSIYFEIVQIEGTEMTPNGNTSVARKKKTPCITKKKKNYGCMRRYSVRFEKRHIWQKCNGNTFFVFTGHMTHSRVT